MKLYLFDLDLDFLTLIPKLDLDMVKMYLYTENKVPSFGSKGIVWTGRNTDRHKYTTPESNYYPPMFTKECIEHQLALWRNAASIHLQIQSLIVQISPESMIF